MAEEGQTRDPAPSREEERGGSAGIPPGPGGARSKERPYERQESESPGPPEGQGPEAQPAPPPKDHRGRAGQKSRAPAKGPRPEAVAAREEARAAVRERRVAEQRRHKSLQRRRRLRNGAVLGLIIIVVTGFIVLGKVRSRASVRAFSRASLAAGCTPVQDTDGNLSHRHLNPGERVSYSTSPPSGGDHNPSPLVAGVYTTAFSDDPNAQNSIYQAVHSMEHGYVEVWYGGSSSDPQFEQLAKNFGNDTKVILSPYPQLPAGKTIGLTVWGRLQTCQKVSVPQVRGFINLYRLKTAPEPLAP